MLLTSCEILNDTTASLRVSWLLVYKMEGSATANAHSLIC